MTSPGLHSPSRFSRAVIAVLAGCLVSGAAAGTAQATGPGDDDWSLSRKADDPALVSQRMTKLKRNPFDMAQWRALKKALGATRLHAKIEGQLERNPKSVAIRILAARALREKGDPAGAAKALEAVEADAGRLKGQVFSMRIDALRDAGKNGAAVSALEKHAEGLQGKARTKALGRALSIADQGDLTADAYRIARRLAELSPDSVDAKLRVARAAAAARDAPGADEAYADALAKASARRRPSLTAERARARMNTDNPSGAADLLWGLLDDPKSGGADVRSDWFELLVEAHRRDGSTTMLVTKLTKWTGKHGQDAAAFRALAEAQQASGMDSTESWRAAIALSPKNAESHAALVDALVAKGDLDGAVSQYEAMSSQAGAEIEVGLALAERLMASGERELGLELAEKIESKAGRKSRTLLLLLDFYNLSDEPQLALEIAKRLVKQSPRKPEVRIALGEQLYQMHHVSEAMAQWAHLPKLITPQHAGLARHAEVLSEHGRTAEAITSLTKALKLAPEEPKYLRLRAVLAEDQRRPGLALGLWEQVRLLAKTKEHKLLRDEARTRVVELLVGGAIPKRQVKLRQAERDARDSLDAKEPLDDAIEAGRLLAELATRRENYSAAVAVQHQLLELAPEDPERLEELATAQRRAGQVSSAIVTLEELMATEPTRKADVLAEMSELAFEAGDHERALESASAAAENDHTQIDALVRLGELHERGGDTEEARRAYQQALGIDETDVRARLRLAELELTMGDVDRSAEAFREILELGGPPELVREAGRRALDLAEAADSTMELLELAVTRTRQSPESREPRAFLLEALERVPREEVRTWLLADGKASVADERQGAMRQPLVAALTRGTIGARLRAAEHLGWLGLPDTAVPLARMGAQLTAPRDATATVREAFDRARITALRAAGSLRDSGAIDLFAQVMDDAGQSMGARHAAAWGLMQADSPEAAKALMGNLEWGHDPLLAALGCIALSGQPADEVSDAHAKLASRLARESRHAQVQHACTLAEAALTPDHRWSRMVPLLTSTDPTVASIGAWRLGRMAKPDQGAIEELLARYIASPGTVRDASGAALARLLGDDEDADADAHTAMPTAPRGTGWATSLERWMTSRLAPQGAQLEPSALSPYAAQVSAAIERASASTRAEQAAAERVLGACDEGVSPARSTGSAPAGSGDGARAVCLAPLLTGTLDLP